MGDRGSGPPLVKSQVAKAFPRKSGTDTPGGILIFSSYVGSGPASTIHLKKIPGISSNPKIF